MRKFIFIALLALSASLSAQPLKWSTVHELNHMGTIGQYIGSIKGKNYFETDYYSYGLLRPLYNRLRLFATDNQNNKIVAQTSKSVKVPSGSLLKMMVLDGCPYAFYITKKEVRYKRFNPNTLEETADKLLYTSSSKKGILEGKIIQSNDKSKIGLILKCETDKKREINNEIAVFDAKLSRLWKQEIQTTKLNKDNILQIVDNILQYQIADNGSMYIYYKIFDKQTKITLITASEKGISTKTLIDRSEFADIENVDNIESYIVDDSTLFIAYSNHLKLKCMKYNVVTGAVMGNVSFDYTTDKTTNWKIRNISKLDNGNFVVAVSNASVLVESSYSMNMVWMSYYLHDKNFYAVCIDSGASKIVYSRMISKGVVFSITSENVARVLMDMTTFERPLFFAKGNDFYAVYNASSNDDDLSEKIVSEVKVSTSFTKSSDKVVTNCVKISAEGKATKTTLAEYKDKKMVLSPMLSFVNDKGDWVLGFSSKKRICFTNLPE